MRAISERDLAVLIPLLAAKIRDLSIELRAGQAREGGATDGADDDAMQIEDMLVQYDGMLETLRSEYEEGLKEGIQLPTFDELVRPFRLESR